MAQAGDQGKNQEEPGTTKKTPRRSKPREKKEFKARTVDLSAAAQFIAKTVVFTMVG